MNNKLIKFNLSQRDSKNIPELRSGDIVKVHRRIKEGDKERVQIFEGIIIAIKGKQSSSPTITVRKISNGVGVELVLPIYSPTIDKIELVKRAKIRRSKLYYIREKSVKALRLKYRDIVESDKADKIEEAEKNITKKDLGSSGDKSDDVIAKKDNVNDKNEKKKKENDSSNVEVETGEKEKKAETDKDNTQEKTP